MDNINFTKTLLALSMTAVLSACGGGGSSPDPVDNSIDATVSGKAAKGIIIGGVVTANELDSSGVVLRVVGNATTDSQGKYSLDLNDNYEGGPIQVVVSKNASTTMVCDKVVDCGTRTDDLTDDNSVIDRGEQYKPGSLEMTAIIPDAEDDESIMVQVTPFTHMAAKRAMAASTLNASSINVANSEVSNLLGGIDILTVEPVDITDPNSISNASSTAVTYAALGASIAELATTDADGQPDITSALATLAANFSNGTVSATGSGFSLQNMVTAAEDSLGVAGASDTSFVLAALQDKVDHFGEGGTVTTTPSENAGDTDVAKAKAFLTDLRTWGVTIGDQLEVPGQAFETQVDMADAAADLINQDGAGEAIALGVMAIVEKFNENISSLTEFVNEDDNSSPFTAGTISSTTTADGLEYSITGGKLTADDESVDLDMTLIIPADGQTGKVITLGVKSIDSESDTAKFTVSSGQITITLEQSYTLNFAQMEAGTAAEPSAIEAIAFDFDLAATQKKTTNTSGDLIDANDDALTIAAALQATLYPYNDSTGEPIDVIPGSFSLNGTFSNATNSIDMGVSASITGAATLQPINEVFDIDSSYDDNNNPLTEGDHLISWQIDGNTFTYNHPYNASVVTYENGSIFVSYNGSTAFNFGTYPSLQSFLQSYGNLNDYDYSFWIEGQGEYVRNGYSYPDYSQSGFVEFILDEPDIEFFDETQPLMGVVGVQFSAQFASLPAALINVEGNATAFEKGNGNITISYGSRQLKFIVANDQTVGDEVSLEITNLDGVKMTFMGKLLNDGIEDNEYAEITINNKVVADVIEQENGSIKVSYIDDTFEIF